jgi:hypothetical protein
MSDLLLQTIIEKLEQLGKDLISHAAVSAQTPEGLKQLSKVRKEYELIKKELAYTRQAITFPADEIKQLSHRLNVCSGLLSKPVQQQVTHHHRITQSLAIGACMLMVIVLLSVLLYNTKALLSDYQTNDIKYRCLKLEPDIGLKRLLYQIDSLCRIDERKMKKEVIQQEHDLQEKLELLQMANEREGEAKLLREKAGKR